MNATAIKVLALSSLSFFVLTLCCQGQFTNTYTFNGDSAGDQFGSSVSNAGDVNGDGFDDIIAGAPFDDNNGNNSGSARVFSGVDGSVLFTFYGNSAFDYLGTSVAGAGDVNGDGFDDVLVSYSNGARVYSGFDGTVLYTFTGNFPSDGFGYALSDLGDINSDGFDDFIISARADATNGSASGSAHVFSGADGSVLFSFYGDSAFDYFGTSASGAGDVNGDGIADIIVGAEFDDNTGLDSGSARVFSGFDGSILYTFNGPAAGAHFGKAVSGAGDINGDGFDDLIVGAPYAGNSGAAQVFSGLDGSLLFSFSGNSSGDSFGFSVSGTGDVNGDGFDDVIVGITGSDINGPDAGSAQVISGVDGSVLSTFYGNSAVNYLGYSVSGAGDINGDGFQDVVVGAFGFNNNGFNSGSALVFTADTLPVLNYATETSFSHFLQLTWQPAGGVPTALTGNIHCSGATPGGTGLAAVSLASQDTVFFGFLPVLVSDAPGQLISTTNFAFDGLGEVLATGISRQSPSLAGLHVYVQFFQTAPLVLGSNGLRFLMAP